MPRKQLFYGVFTFRPISKRIVDGVSCIRYLDQYAEVMPEKFFLDRRPPFPLCNKKIKIMIGKPLEFDIPKMRELAISKSRGDVFSSTTTSRGWPVISSYGLDLDEAAQRYLYSSISDEIQSAMEELQSSLK
ncbi:hypothetical protein GOBAR_AA30278 [Gossypium barbadense]|uniref:Uncharacterized protein n=1 Tax=Gossypium barbadense TaxID=3634 RepID=A0A2P5WH32_GOSBA|nr:hypothetical protein GOBAR_AA30278 [Gossypium barbadense]